MKHMKLLIIFNEVKKSSLSSYRGTETLVFTTDYKIHRMLTEDGFSCIYKSVYRNVSPRMTDLEKFIEAKRFDQSFEGKIPLCYPYINHIARNTSNFIEDVIAELRSIIDTRDIEELVLFGGNQDVEYLSVFFAEGERPFRLLYKRSWYLNYYIYHILGASIKVVWRKQESKIKLRFYKSIRRKALTLLRGSIIAIQSIKNKSAIGTGRKNHKAIETNIHEKGVVLLSLRSSAQIVGVISLYDRLLQRKELNVTPVIMSSKMLQSKELNMNSSGTRNQIDLYEHIGIISLIRNMVKLSITKRKIIKECKNIQLCHVSYVELIDEISQSWIEIIFRYKSLDHIQFKIKNVTCVYTSETFNHNAAIEGIWARSNHIPIYTLQQVAYPNKVYPKHVWTDGLFVTSKYLFDYLVENDKQGRYFFEGPFSMDHLFDTYEMNQEKTNDIVIFTQPDGYLPHYISLLELIADTYSGTGKVVIKLHPRDHKVAQYRKFINSYHSNSGCRFELIEEDPIRLIQTSGLVISMTSNVLFQSVIIGAPTLSAKLKDSYDIKGRDYLEKGCIPIIKDEETLKTYINNTCWHKAYYDDRVKYLKEQLNGYNGNALDEILNKTFIDG